MSTIAIDGASLTLEDVDAVARGSARVILRGAPAVRDRIGRSYMGQGMPIYGVTTGLGPPHRAGSRGAAAGQSHRLSRLRRGRVHAGGGLGALVAAIEADA